MRTKKRQNTKIGEKWRKLTNQRIRNDSKTETSVLKVAETVLMTNVRVSSVKYLQLFRNAEGMSELNPALCVGVVFCSPIVRSIQIPKEQGLKLKNSHTSHKAVFCPGEGIGADLLPVPADEAWVTLNALDSFITLVLLLTWESAFLIPLAAEVKDSGQTYDQQCDTHYGDGQLLLSHWLEHQLWLFTPVPVETQLTPAVVLIDVHQEHALAVVQAVIVE